MFIHLLIINKKHCKKLLKLHKKSVFKNKYIILKKYIRVKLEIFWANIQTQSQAVSQKSDQTC